MVYREQNNQLTEIHYPIKKTMTYDIGNPCPGINKVITKLPNSEQYYKGKVQTHNYINRQSQSTTGKL